MGCECSTCGDDKTTFSLARSGDCHPLVVELANQVERTRAIEAIRKNDIVLVQKMLNDIKPMQNLYEPGANYTSLHCASEFNAYNIVEPLLVWLKRNIHQHYNEIVNIPDKYGRTPAMLCAMNDSAEVLFSLLSNGGVDTEVRDSKQRNLEELCKEYSFRCLSVLEHYRNPSKLRSLDGVSSDGSTTTSRTTMGPSKAEEVVGEVLKRLTKVQIARSLEEIQQNQMAQKKVDDSLQGVSLNSKTFATLSQLLTTGGVFSDKDFAHNVKSITTDIKHPNIELYSKAVWRRPHEIFGVDYPHIFLYDKIDPNSIEAGKLGTHYFLTALCSLAEFPSRLQRVFTNKKSNKYGVYGLNLFVQGTPTEILVDDSFPCTEVSGKATPIFSRNKGRELWVLLAEKAWAKLYGSYTVFDVGFMDEAFEYLLGTPSFRYFNHIQSEDEIWESLVQAGKDNCIVSVATGSQTKPESGLIANQAYSVISVHNELGHKIVKMRNPWSKSEWKGDFSDSSQFWTPELRQKIGAVEAEDGIFCMNVKDFKENFTFYSTAIYKEGWEYTYIKGGNEPKHPEYFKFIVQENCEAYFRIQLKDKRFVPDELKSNYAYPQADFVIAKVESDETLTNLVPDEKDLDTTSKTGARTMYPTKYHKLKLVPGTYVIRVKVAWKQFQQGDYTLSAYADHKLDLYRIPHIKDFHRRLFQRAASKVDKSKLPNGCALAIGNDGQKTFLYAENHGSLPWTIDAKLNLLDNMKIAKPGRISDNQLKLVVQPNSFEVAFLKTVDYAKTHSYQWEIKHTHGTQ